jgi:hypothetical protein
MTVHRGRLIFMETDLSIRLHLYATAAERLARGAPRGDTAGCADAISCWRSAAASHSAGIVNSHTRVLRGDFQPDPSQAGDPGKDELDILIAGKHGKAADSATDQNTDTQRRHLPLPPGNNSAEILALGAEGVIILKGRNG